MWKHIWLLCMCLSYAYPVSIVATFQNASSVSSVVVHSMEIFVSMIAMGFFTLLYEFHRNQFFSLVCIIGLLIGIYGLLIHDEDSIEHQWFTYGTFLSIYIFMLLHSYVRQDMICKLILSIQTMLCGWFLWNI